AIVLVFAGSMLSACGGLTVKDIVINSGIPAEIAQGATFDKSNISAKVIFSDDSSVDVLGTSDDLIVTLDTSTVGNTFAIVKYQKYDFELKVPVCVAEITGISLTAYTGTYDATSHPAIDSITGTLAGDTISYATTTSTPTTNDWSTTMPEFTNAGSHKVWVKVARDDKSREFEKTVVIAKKDLTAKVADFAITYGDPIPTYNITYTGFAGLDDATVIETATTVSCAYTTDYSEATCPITLSGGSAANYNIVCENSTLTINGTEVAATVTAYTSHLLAAYESNIDNSQKGPKEQFIDTDNPITAGDDNIFDLQLTATLWIDGDEEEGINRFETLLSFAIKDGNNFNALNASDINEYFDDVDNINNTIDFSADAIGNMFKITVFPKNTDDAYGLEPVEYIVRVVDGYNVYNANDLSVLTNDTENGWSAWKQGTKYQDIVANAVILQNNINVTSANIPSAYFYEGNGGFTPVSGNLGYAPKIDDHGNLVDDTTKPITINGSMKDNASLHVYKRILADGDTFNFYGNYFNVQYNELPIVVVQNEDKMLNIPVGDRSGGDAITTHTSFMGFYNGAADECGDNINVNIQDAYFIGNGRRSSDAYYSGGIMLCKIDEINSTITNTIFKDCFIGWMFDTAYNKDTAYADRAGVQNKLIDSKGYNSYSSLLYAWGAYNVYIEGGEYVSAGGPAIIADYVEMDNNIANGWPTNIAIVGTYLESIVTGNEPWFVQYGAKPLVAHLNSLNKVYQNGSATILRDLPDPSNPSQTIQNMMNLKVVYKSGSSEGPTATEVYGNVQYFKDKAEYDAWVADNGTALTHKALDMTANSANAIQNNTQMINSRTGVNAGTTQYMIIPVAMTGRDFPLLVKLSDMMAFQAAKAEYDQAVSSGDETAHQNAVAKLSSFFCGAYVKAQNVMMVGGTVADNFQSGTPYYLAAAGTEPVAGEKMYAINTGTGLPETAPAATIESVQLDEEGTYIFNSFVISTPATGYDTVYVPSDSNEKNPTGTNTNIYLFNGMGAIIELFPYTKPASN
ncbi:MAG: hypothetical protein IKC79_02985, partial [Clostridia bacterium]|nr:hypothetical protein [Clostridia bacterium]